MDSCDKYLSVKNVGECGLSLKNGIDCGGRARIDNMPVDSVSLLSNG